MVRYYLAYVYIQVGREEDALNLIRDAVERASFIPSSGDSYNDALINSAQIYALMSRYEDSIMNLDIYIERFNHGIGRKRSINPARQMYLNIYEWDQSLEDYNLALELDPDYAEAYFQRGLLYYSILQTARNCAKRRWPTLQPILTSPPDGPHADEAHRYIETIEAALAALEND